MALQSTLFRGDPQLDAVAVSDPAHIVPGAKGPHVVKIQQALIQLDGASITADGAYGQGTATAVSAFKQKRQILNFQGQIDNIVGKKTIAALDSEMIAKEKGGGKGGGKSGFKTGVLRISGSSTTIIVPAFKPGEISRVSGVTGSSGVGRRLGVNSVGDAPLLQSLNPLVVQPFNEPNTFVLAQQFDFDNGPKGDKNDLDTNDPPTRPLTGPEKQKLDNFACEQGAFTTQQIEDLARTEAFAANFSDGTGLMDRFFANTNPNLRVEFKVGSNISNRVRDSKGFATEHNGIDKDIREALQRQFLTGTIDYRKMKGKVSPVPDPRIGFFVGNPDGVKAPPGVGFGLTEFRLAALIGNFQGSEVSLKSFDVDKQLFTYRATLRYELIDHFGVDNSDLLLDFSGHGTAGQVALWKLQHLKKHRPGHIPYRTVVIVEKEITGSLLDPQLFPDLNLQEILRQFSNGPSFFPK